MRVEKIVVAAFAFSILFIGQAIAEDEPVTKGPFSSQGTQIFVRAEGPATRETPLQAACFFKHQQSGDLLSGGTETFNEKMNGLIKKLRDAGDFQGAELETMLITPAPGTIRAEKLLLIGLGDPKTFTAERMKQVGNVAAREAFKLGVTKLSFSPNVTDAGVKVAKVQDFDTQVVEGVLQAIDTQRRLAKAKLVPPVVLSEFTLEAGAANIPAAEAAVKAAIEASENSKSNQAY